MFLIQRNQCRFTAVISERITVGIGQTDSCWVDSVSARDGGAVSSLCASANSSGTGGIDTSDTWSSSFGDSLSVCVSTFVVDRRKQGVRGNNLTCLPSLPVTGVYYILSKGGLQYFNPKKQFTRCSLVGYR